MICDHLDFHALDWHVMVIKETHDGFWVKEEFKTMKLIEVWPHMIVWPYIVAQKTYSQMNTCAMTAVKVFICIENRGNFWNKDYSYHDDTSSNNQLHYEQVL